MNKKGLVWDRTTANLKLVVADVPTEVTKEELIALLTITKMGVRWEDWRTTALDWQHEISQRQGWHALALQLTQSIQVTFAQLLEASPPLKDVRFVGRKSG